MGLRHGLQYFVSVVNDSQVEAICQVCLRTCLRCCNAYVVLEAEYAGQAKSPWGTVSAGFSAETKINRRDWGLNWNAVLEAGGVLVGETVDINSELEIVKQPETEATPA